MRVFSVQSVYYAQNLAGSLRPIRRLRSIDSEPFVRNIFEFYINGKNAVVLNA